jgi:hypothetical protein
MADSGLHITVTTEDAKIAQFVGQLNSGELALGKVNKQLRDLKSAAIPGSQALKDLIDIQRQLGDQSRSTEAREQSLIGTIRQSRQERRLGMFAINESLHALEAATGSENQFAKAVSGGATAVFGIKFALDAMGESMSKVALPIAIAVGLWTVLRDLFGGSAEASKKLNEELKKQNETVIGLVENLEKLGKVSRDQLKNFYQTQIEVLKAQNAQSKTVTNVQMVNGVPIVTKHDELALSPAERDENLKKITDFQLKQQALDKQDAEDQKKKTQELEKQQQALEKSQQAAWSMAEAFRVAMNSLQPKSSKKNPIPFVDTKENGKSFSESLADEFSKGEKSASQFSKVLDQGISHSTNLLAEGFAKAFGLGNSLADRLLEQMLSIAAQMAETYALQAAAMALTAGATGNIFTALGAMIFDEGGTINEPVVGRGMKSGLPYGFAMNGKPEQVSTLNQMGQASRGGGGGGAPYVQVFPIINSSGLAVQVEIGNQQNKRLRN